MNQFKKIIHDLTALFEEQLPLEQEKLKAVQENNVAVVEDCMKKEQAVMLKLRGLEQKRENAQQELGWEGKTFREIIELAPQEERQELQQMFDRLSAAIRVFRETNEGAMDAMSVQLREIEKVIKLKDTEGRYSQNGNEMKIERPMTSRKV